MLAWLVAAVLSAANPEAAKLASEGMQKAQSGDFVGARASLEQAQKLSPENAPIAFNLAQVLERLGESNAAAEAYERYLKLSPRAADAAQVKDRVQKLRASAGTSPEARKLLLKG